MSSAGDIKLQGDIAANAAAQALKGSYDKAYLDALLEVGKGSLQRSRDAADFVQKAAAAIGVLYSGILKVSFSVANKPLPVQGFIPSIFLGLAIFLSTAYVAYAEKPADVELEPLSSDAPVRLQRHVDNFIHIINDAVGRRQSVLRASVIALGIGVITLPTPFITLPTVPSQASAQASPSPSASKPDWPSPPAVSDSLGNALLQSILYKAQVDEIAAKRKESIPSSEPNWALWGLLTVAGLVIVLWGPVRDGWRRRNNSQQEAGRVT